MANDGRIWTERQLQEAWNMPALLTRERIFHVAQKGMCELVTLYYYKDDSIEAPPVAMRPYKERKLNAPQGFRAGLGLIFRGCTVDDAPQSYRSHIAAVPQWQRNK